MKILVEATGPVRIQNEGKRVFLEGIGFRANIKNKNNRIYEETILSNAIESIMPAVKEGSFMGTLNHDSNNSASVNLQNVSHIVQSINKRGSDWHVRSRLIEHGAGAVASAILSAGGKCGYSSRSMGSTTRKNNVDYVNEDLHILSLDLVHAPSTPGSMVALKECANSKNLNEAIVARQLLEAGPRGNSLANLPTLSKQDAGAFGFSNSFDASPSSYLDRSNASTQDIVRKLTQFQNLPSWDNQTYGDAADLRRTISAAIADPFLKQKLLTALEDAYRDQVMKKRAADYLARYSRMYGKGQI